MGINGFNDHHIELYHINKIVQKSGTALMRMETPYELVRTSV